MPSWPDLEPVEASNALSLFDGLDSLKKYVVLVYEPENSTVGVETILHFLRYPNITVKRITDLELASRYQIDGTKYKIAIVNRQGSVVPYAPANELSSSYKETIISFLNSEHITEKPDVKTETTSFKPIENTGEVNNKILKILEEKFLTVLDRYNPLGVAGRLMLKRLSEFASGHIHELSGEDFENKVKELDDELQPVYSSTNFVGCAGSQAGLRDPLEVLQAMHGYIKHFFGCTDCSEHFQAMALRRKIWNTSSKDDAVLWLWEAHNEVNNRLAGDATEDPKFPKIQFPSGHDFSQPNPKAANKQVEIEVSYCTLLNATLKPVVYDKLSIVQ
ncbi:Sulfhydryl oxidase 1 [Eumeta japonica]|uniref:Sulfhydryl oxidase n=1 Tax=Eumeta variegata TaxID=151549 RepID=A0A4C1T3B8_EUMVA|nr:Sulfhydryl oxidase 1 [Eumeta japonica]